MSSTIFYKDKAILSFKTSILESLLEKTLFYSLKNFDLPHSNIVFFIEKCLANQGGNISKELNSKEEVLQFASFLELALNSLIQENYFNLYNYKKKGEVINIVLDQILLFIQGIQG